VNPLERVEAAATASFVRLCGGRTTEVGGARCFAHPTIPATELNRAIPLSREVDLDAIAAWFDGVSHVVAVVPEQRSLEDALVARRYEPVRSWMKFERGVEATAVHETDLTVREATDPEPFALVTCEGYGLPDAARPVFAALVGAPDWHCFVAWAGDEPAGAGALHLDGEAAWLGVGATRPQFRRRGAQAAVLAARIDAARAAGATMLATETGERVPDQPSTSYRNILRAGFREAYVRANWRSPT